MKRAGIVPLVMVMALTLVALPLGAADSPPSEAGSFLKVMAPKNGSGLKLTLDWVLPVAPGATQAVLRSAQSAAGPWTVAKSGLAADKRSYTDRVTDDSAKHSPADHYWYRVVALPPGRPPRRRPTAVPKFSPRETEIAPLGPKNENLLYRAVAACLRCGVTAL